MPLQLSSELLTFMQNPAVIYMLRNRKNGLFYTGSTRKGLQMRLYQHWADMSRKLPYHRASTSRLVLADAAKDDIEMIVLEACVFTTKAAMLQRECVYFDRWFGKDPLYVNKYRPIGLKPQSKEAVARGNAKAKARNQQWLKKRRIEEARVYEQELILGTLSANIHFTPANTVSEPQGAPSAGASESDESTDTDSESQVSANSCAN